MTHHHDFGEISWPFETPTNTLAYTTIFVLQGSLPIVEVYHDHDGDWQFLCGTSNEAAHVKLVCLGCLIERDQSLFGLADLPAGWSAVRTSPGQTWKREPFADGDD